MNLNGRIFGLKFHTITVESAEPLITYLRLGLITTELIVSLCPLKERFRAGSDMFIIAAYVRDELTAPFAPKDD
jgi:hypothetical protein